MIRQSLGGQLLLDAFTVVSVAIAVAAGRLFVVNAIYERTVNIYWHIGFTPLRKKRLCAHIDDVAASMESGAHQAR